MQKMKVSSDGRKFTKNAIRVDIWKINLTFFGNCPTWCTNSFQCIYLFIVLYMFRARHAHHQEKQIVSIQLLVIVTPCWWQCRVLVGSLLPTSTRKEFVHQVGQLPRIIAWCTVNKTLNYARYCINSSSSSYSSTALWVWPWPPYCINCKTEISVCLTNILSNWNISSYVTGLSEDGRNWLKNAVILVWQHWYQ